MFPLEFFFQRFVTPLTALSGGRRVRFCRRWRELGKVSIDTHLQHLLTFGTIASLSGATKVVKAKRSHRRRLRRTLGPAAETANLNRDPVCFSNSEYDLSAARICEGGYVGLELIAIFVPRADSSACNRERGSLGRPALQVIPNRTP